MADSPRSHRADRRAKKIASQSQSSDSQADTDHSLPSDQDLPNYIRLLKVTTKLTLRGERDEGESHPLDSLTQKKLTDSERTDKHNAVLQAARDELDNCIALSEELHTGDLRFRNLTLCKELDEKHFSAHSKLLELHEHVEKAKQSMATSYTNREHDSSPILSRLRAFKLLEFELLSVKRILSAGRLNQPTPKGMRDLNEVNMKYAMDTLVDAIADIDTIQISRACLSQLKVNVPGLVPQFVEMPALGLGIPASYLFALAGYKDEVFLYNCNFHVNCNQTLRPLHNILVHLLEQLKYWCPACEGADVTFSELESHSAICKVKGEKTNFSTCDFATSYSKNIAERLRVMKETVDSFIATRGNCNELIDVTYVEELTTALAAETNFAILSRIALALDVEVGNPQLKYLDRVVKEILENVSTEIATLNEDIKAINQAAIDKLTACINEKSEAEVSIVSTLAELQSLEFERFARGAPPLGASKGETALRYNLSRLNPFPDNSLSATPSHIVGVTTQMSKTIREWRRTATGFELKPQTTLFKSPPPAPRTTATVDPLPFRDTKGPTNKRDRKPRDKPTGKYIWSSSDDDDFVPKSLPSTSADASGTVDTGAPVPAPQPPSANPVASAAAFEPFAVAYLEKYFSGDDMPLLTELDYQKHRKLYKDGYKDKYMPRYFYRLQKQDERVKIVTYDMGVIPETLVEGLPGSDFPDFSLGVRFFPIGLEPEDSQWRDQSRRVLNPANPVIPPRSLPRRYPKSFFGQYCLKYNVFVRTVCGHEDCTIDCGLYYYCNLPHECAWGISGRSYKPDTQCTNKATCKHLDLTTTRLTQWGVTEGLPTVKACKYGANRGTRMAPRKIGLFEEMVAHALEADCKLFWWECADSPYDQVVALLRNDELQPPYRPHAKLEIFKPLKKDPCFLRPCGNYKGLCAIGGSTSKSEENEQLPLHPSRANGGGMKLSNCHIALYEATVKQLEAKLYFPNMADAIDEYLKARKVNAKDVDELKLFEPLPLATEASLVAFEKAFAEGTRVPDWPPHLDWLTILDAALERGLSRNALTNARVLNESLGAWVAPGGTRADEKEPPQLRKKGKSRKGFKVTDSLERRRLQAKKAKSNVLPPEPNDEPKPKKRAYNRKPKE